MIDCLFISLPYRIVFNLLVLLLQACTYLFDLQEHE